MIPEGLGAQSYLCQLVDLGILDRFGEQPVAERFEVKSITSLA